MTAITTRDAGVRRWPPPMASLNSCGSNVAGRAAPADTVVACAKQVCSEIAYWFHAPS